MTTVPFLFSALEEYPTAAPEAIVLYNSHNFLVAGSTRSDTQHGAFVRFPSYHGNHMFFLFYLALMCFFWAETTKSSFRLSST